MALPPRAFPTGLAGETHLDAEEWAADIQAHLAKVPTGGSTREAGGAFHIFNDPAVAPVGPQAGDLWVGDLA